MIVVLICLLVIFFILSNNTVKHEPFAQLDTAIQGLKDIGTRIRKVEGSISTGIQKVKGSIRTGPLGPKHTDNHHLKKQLETHNILGYKPTIHESFTNNISSAELLSREMYKDPVHFMTDKNLNIVRQEIFRKRKHEFTQNQLHELTTNPFMLISDGDKRQIIKEIITHINKPESYESKKLISMHIYKDLHKFVPKESIPMIVKLVLPKFPGVRMSELEIKRIQSDPFSHMTHDQKEMLTSEIVSHLT